jgi:hypothetical protein
MLLLGGGVQGRRPVLGCGRGMLCAGATGCRCPEDAVRPVTSAGVPYRGRQTSLGDHAFVTYIPEAGALQRMSGLDRLSQHPPSAY